MEKEAKRSRIRKAAAAAILLLAAVFAVASLEALTERGSFFVPDYQQMDLRSAINGRELTDKQYALLFRQTGLGRAAVDKTLQKAGYLASLERYQDRFFHGIAYECRSIGIITSEERFRDEQGNKIAGFSLVDVQDGDIFLTKATHSLSWRHGHAAIVIDAENKKTLESVLWGKPSVVQPLRKWQTYPTMIQLRVKEEAAKQLGYEREELGKTLAQYARETLDDMDYALLSGFWKKAEAEISKTQCAHLVWYAYQHFGLDIDSDGGWLVTPKDIAGSQLLEIVQIYGVNPDAIWD